MATTSAISPTRTFLVAVLAVIASILSLGVALVVVGTRRFDRLVRKDVEQLLAQCRPQRDTVVTEEMLQELPAPVQRYLRYSDILGKPVMRTAYVKQKGTMQLSPGGRRIPLDFHTYYCTQPPGYVWSGTMHIGPLPLARARDLYRAGQGNMLVKAASFVTVVDGKGEEMNQGSMMRYLSEMSWFPAAFLSDVISFEAVDDTSARVRFTDGGRRVTGTLHIDEVGRLTDFTAQQWRTRGNGYELTPWSATPTGYGEMEGLRLPIQGKGVWHLPEGDHEYIESEITELRYDSLGPPHFAAATKGGAEPQEAPDGPV